MDNSVNIQTFNTAYPFSVSIKNQYQQEESSVIYIVNKVDASDNMQQIKIDISVTDQEIYRFQGFNFANQVPSPAAPSPFTNSSPQNSGFAPNKDQFNIAFAFRPGTLRQSVLEGLTETIQQSLVAFLTSDNQCVTNGPIVRGSDGALIWYCAFQKDIQITQAKQENCINSISLMLNGISADPGVGSRSTQVELLFSSVYKGESKNQLTFLRSKQVDIINHQGHSYAPLSFGVYGSNRLVNNAKNSFTLFFQTLDLQPIGFGKDTSIEFSFPYNDPDLQYMSFGDQSLVNAYELDIPNINYPINPFSNPVTLPPDGLNQVTIQTSTNIVETIPNPLIAQLQNERQSNFVAQISSSDYYINSANNDQNNPYVTFSPYLAIQNYLYLINNSTGTPYNNTGENQIYMSSNDPFSVTQWTNCYNNLKRITALSNFPVVSLLNSDNNDFNNVPGVSNVSVILSTSGQQVDSNFDPDSAWTNQDFVAYVTTNYNALCKKITGNKGHGMGQDTDYDYEFGSDALQMVPCQSLYDFFWLNYEDSLLAAQQQLPMPPITQYLTTALYQFNFSNIMLSGIDGTVPITILIKNLPGYWDTYFQVPMIKESVQPMLQNVSNQNNVPDASSFPVGSILVQQGENGVFAKFPGDSNANVNNIPTQTGSWVTSSQFWSDEPNNAQRYTYVVFIKTSN